MNILQPYDRDVPEQKDKTEEDQAGENQKSDEDSLLRFNVQSNLLTIADKKFGVINTNALYLL